MDNKHLSSDSAFSISRNQALILRTLCVLAIGAHHIYQDLALYEEATFLPPYFIMKKLGYLGCGIFFFLSGYGLIKSIQAKEPITFGYVLRHLWELLLITILCEVTSGVVEYWEARGSVSAYTLIRDSLLSDGLWFTKAIIGGYIALFAICKATTSHTCRAVSGMCLALAYIIWMAGFTSCGNYWYNSILCFPLGIAIGGSSIRRRAMQWASGSSAVLLLTCFAAGHLGWDNVFSEMLQAIFLCMVAIYLVTYIHYDKAWALYIGKNSYYFYLLHFMVIALFVPLTKNFVGMSVLTTVVSTVVVFLVSTLRQAIKQYARV